MRLKELDGEFCRALATKLAKTQELAQVSSVAEIRANVMSTNIKICDRRPKTD